ncbi:MAG: hypothetical protein M1830_004173 [Pleopsidium flavum]|nr:MAG: hypothetical protein M1830_004173 [Pleopsidium flavum]
MEPSCHILPEISVQYPSSDQIYIHKTDADCVSIAAQMMRMRQLEENESTLLGFLNSNLLPWPLVHRNAKLRRIQEKPILQASILDEPPVNLNVQDSNERSLSWNLTPDTLFLYSATSGFESNDIEQLNNLGLSRDIIALNGEFKSASGSALEARLQMVCAGVLVLLQRSKIHKAAGSADRARSPSLAPLSHYCFSICSGDYEIWRLEYVDDKFHGWQEFCGSLVYCHGVREFINIWNRLIHQVTGSQWDSLLADIRQTTVVKANDTESWRKRLRPRKR